MGRIAAWACLLCSLLSPDELGAAEPLLRDGDRVVLIGSTLIERDQSHGYLETLLVSRFPDRSLTFRNLGWSGDTVFGEARAGFDTPAEGFRRLREHVLALKPTVLLVGYGTNESFGGPGSLSRFSEGLKALLDALAPAEARLVLHSPNRLEDLGRPLPDPSQRNQDLLLYRDALRLAAVERHAALVDLYESLNAPDRDHPLTDNSLHLTAFGYWRASGVIAEGLGVDPKSWTVLIDEAGRPVETRNTVVSKAERTSRGFRFEALDAALPLPPPPGGAPTAPALTGGRRPLRLQKLENGRYVLRIDGREVTAFEHAGGDALIAIDRGPEFDQVERLRREVVEKNRLYFYRWRPQNETYLFGFRKHEQGQNAREIPQFDPLVAARESAIAKLKTPVPHTYELSREEAAP